MNWDSMVKLSQEAFREGVNDWIGKARIQGGTVNGSVATLPAGSLSSEANIETKMLQSLLSAQVPADVARTLAKHVSGAWNEWAAGFKMQLPSAYPSFVAYPGPVAPPTFALPFPLSQATSAGESALKAAVLAPKLSSALKSQGAKLTGSPDQAIKALTKWIELSFLEWKQLALLVGIMGRGSVPTFAPPYVPVGPVIKGDNLSRGPIFAGPRFGRAS